MPRPIDGHDDTAYPGGAEGLKEPARDLGIKNWDGKVRKQKGVMLHGHRGSLAVRRKGHSIRDEYAAGWSSWPCLVSGFRLGLPLCWRQTLFR